jgi:predicted dithiol-disulfide oxidoreductase (DUF899 family)
MATVVDRDELLHKLQNEEIALRNHIEDVAAMRRQLPLGRVLDDYVFHEGPADLSRTDPSGFRDVRLSQLFEPGKNELVIYHMMYGPDWQEACPMCTLWVTGLDAVAPYITERVNFAVVAKADIAKLRAWAKTRGWRHARYLSSSASKFNIDLGAEDAEGGQIPGLSVFVKGDDGKVRHSYTKHANLSGDLNRGIDLLSPVWNVFDLAPSGRDDWNPTGWWGFLD